MKNKKSLIIILFLLIIGNTISFSQNITGTVYGNADGEKEILESATVKWINTLKGTLTLPDGSFELSLSGITDQRLLVSFAGFKTDTLDVEGRKNIEIEIMSNSTTGTIEVEKEKNSTFFGNYDAKTEVITSQELVKDACCDLAGCFGRNSSVEVAVTDIITDSKELKILGLEGAYTQVLVDNMPMMSGLNVKYGVSSIPGTLIDRITVSKGSNSVLQGYESISGIMNVLLKDHGNSNRLLLNAFMNSMLEKQFNLNFTHSTNRNVNTILALHSVQKSRRVDDNNDGFLDNPLITRYMLYNKWNYNNEKNRTSLNFAGRYWNEERIGGQKNYNESNNTGVRIYGQTVKINSIDGYSRFSKEFNETSAVKMYLTSSYYNQKSVYGSTDYSARQTMFSSFGFYEFEMSEGIEFKTGLSYKYLGIEEDIKFNDTTSKTYAGNYFKKESIPGVFAENSLRLFNDKASLMTGIRFDFHNEHKLIVTPRALIRYQPTKQLVMRASIGTGFRTLNMFSEYSNLLSSSRNIVIGEMLEAEKTLNYGADVIYYFGFNKIGGSLNIDYYRTDFSNKIIPDYDADVSEVIFSNLHGKAYSNVLQTELNLTVLSNIDLKIAYKYVELKYEKNGVLYEQPFNAKHRVLSAFSYSPTGKSWSVSGGLQWFGKQRLPSTSSNPVEYRRPEESKPYVMLNAQFNKNFKMFEVYAGVENILNFTQDDPIISADNPFGKYFDTSYNWGPTKGREFYAGFRFLID